MALKNGTRVHVEFDGETVTEPWIRNLLANPDVMFDNGDGGFTGIIDPDGIVHLLWHRASYDGAAPDVFTAADPEPEFWPPRVGDIWALPPGIEYAIRQNWAVPGAVVADALERVPLMTGQQQTYYEGEGYADYRQLDRFRELSPVLMRRR